MHWEALSDHCLTDAWSKKEHHLAMECDIIRRLVVKRKRALSPGGILANTHAPITRGIPELCNSQGP